MSGGPSSGPRSEEDGSPSGTRYRVRRGTLRFTYGYLLFLTVITAFGLAVARPRILFAVLLMYLAWRWYEMLRTPTRITVRPEGTVEFRSVLGSTVLEPEAIKLIRRGWRGFWLQHDGGVVALVGGIENFHELVAEIRASNPDLRVQGITQGNAE